MSETNTDNLPDVKVKFTIVFGEMNGTWYEKDFVIEIGGYDWTQRDSATSSITASPLMELVEFYANRTTKAPELEAELSKSLSFWTVVRYAEVEN